jgi:hypothetical protein
LYSENRISPLSKIEQPVSLLDGYPVVTFISFLCLPHLISKANDEEKNVEKLGSEDKFNRKSIIFTARIDEIIKMKSIVD